MGAVKLLFQKGSWTASDFPCEILYRICGGHMAQLYVARLKHTEHLVVVKAAAVNTIAATLLEKEAKILQHLHYKGIPEVYTYQKDTEKSYYIMSYHKGLTIEQYMQRNGCMFEKTICTTVQQLCQILAYLHSERVRLIHNDLKPSNVLLQENGEVILLDFGLAEYIEHAHQTDICFQGTFGYAAPECWHRKQLGNRIESDIFSLGATLYYMLEAKSPKDCYGKFILSEQNHTKKNRWQPVLDKCCALNIEQRYQNTALVYKNLCQIKF